MDRVIDGDTIDITINLGFDFVNKTTSKSGEVDTPEKRTRDHEIEKPLGIDATKNSELDYIDNNQGLMIRIWCILNMVECWVGCM